jgi:uncharacterized protein YhhL (DUF1145 family)
VIVLAWWLFFVGVWPFADPGHRDLNPMVVADVLIHVGALAVLVAHYWPRRHLRQHTDRWELLP